MQIYNNAQFLTETQSPNFKIQPNTIIQGDCLNVMKYIPDNSIDMILTDPPEHSSIVLMYTSGMTMRGIAKQLGINHKLVSKILKDNGITTRPPKNTRNIRKFQCVEDVKYNNMLTHLRFNVKLDWLKKFKDFDKLKLLNEVITNRDKRFNESTEWYINYIEKFYYDSQFNNVYQRWLESEKEQYMKPSIDHIYPKAKGGTNDLNNLQFLTWFENRCKNDMTQEQWENLKTNITRYFI